MSKDLTRERIAELKGEAGECSAVYAPVEINADELLALLEMAGRCVNGEAVYLVHRMLTTGEKVALVDFD